MNTKPNAQTKLIEKHLKNALKYKSATYSLFVRNEI